MTRKKPRTPMVTSLVKLGRRLLPLPWYGAVVDVLVPALM